MVVKLLLFVIVKVASMCYELFPATFVLVHLLQAGDVCNVVCLYVKRELLHVEPAVTQTFARKAFATPTIDLPHSLTVPYMQT